MINRVLKHLFFWVLLFAFGTAQGQDREGYIFSSFREPGTDGLYLLYSYDGYNWKNLGGPYLEPKVGGSQLMRDPSIERGPDGTFHMVWTTGWKGDLGFGYAHSQDLVHWSEQKFIPVMEHESTTVNVWAPELFYDKENDRYIILWASTIPYRFPKGQEAEDNNHRMYYTTTKDFKTFSETKLFLDPGFSVIDATIVKRAKDDYVLVSKDNTRPERNLSVAFSKDPLGPYKNISKPFTDKFTEGPTVINLDDSWLIYYDAYEAKEYRAMKTDDFQHFTNVTDQIEVPEGHKHGTIVKASQSVLEGLKKSQILKLIRHEVKNNNAFNYST